jgi:hypothetical protein
MSWITITEADVKNRLNSAEWQAVNSRALVAGMNSPVDDVIADVTAEVRRKVASCRHNRLSTDDAMIPAGLKSQALALIVVELLRRYGSHLLKETDPRLAAEKAARTDLDRVADCQDAVELPETPEAAAVQPSPSPAFGERTRNWTSSTQEGI